MAWDVMCPQCLICAILVEHVNIHLAQDNNDAHEHVAKHNLVEILLKWLT